MGSCAFTIPCEVEEEQSQEFEMTPQQKIEVLKTTLGNIQRKAEKVDEAIRKFVEIREKSSMNYEEIRKRVASRQKKRNNRQKKRDNRQKKRDNRRKNKKIPGGCPTPSA
jgi:vacuolar-type H+-ATPase subunit I/STV1